MYTTALDFPIAIRLLGMGFQAKRVHRDGFCRILCQSRL